MFFKICNEAKASLANRQDRGDLKYAPNAQTHSCPPPLHMESPIGTCMCTVTLATICLGSFSKRASFTAGKPCTPPRPSVPSPLSNEHGSCVRWCHGGQPCAFLGRGTQYTAGVVIGRCSGPRGTSSWGKSRARWSVRKHPIGSGKCL